MLCHLCCLLLCSNKQAYQASGIHVAEELGSVTQCDFLRNAPWSTVSFRTLLNSWGNSSTSDGLFRIAMGQAGVYGGLLCLLDII